MSVPPKLQFSLPSVDSPEFPDGRADILGKWNLFSEIMMFETGQLRDLGVLNCWVEGDGVFRDRVELRFDDALVGVSELEIDYSDPAALNRISFHVLSPELARAGVLRLAVFLDDEEVLRYRVNVVKQSGQTQ